MVAVATQVLARLKELGPVLEKVLADSVRQPGGEKGSDTQVFSVAFQQVSLDVPTSAARPSLQEAHENGSGAARHGGHLRRSN